MKLRERGKERKKREKRENLRRITTLSLAKKLRFITHDSSAH